MSNFTCEHCKREIIDSPTGYVTGCPHYPLPKGRPIEPPRAEVTGPNYSPAPYGYGEKE